MPGKSSLIPWCTSAFLFPVFSSFTGGHCVLSTCESGCLLPHHTAPSLTWSLWQFENKTAHGQALEVRGWWFKLFLCMYLSRKLVMVSALTTRRIIDREVTGNCSQKTGNRRTTELSRQGLQNSRQRTLKDLPPSRSEQLWSIAPVFDFCCFWLGGSCYNFCAHAFTDVCTIGKKVLLSSCPSVGLKYLKGKVSKFQ